MYYTPSIKEFHVGFEFEVMNNNRAEWKPMSVLTVDAIKVIEINFFPNFTRVKYLSKECIEECRWEFIKADKKNKSYEMFSLGDYDMVYNYYSKWCCIARERGDRKGTIFAGYIKNKSKFKDVMEMLNIE